MIQLFRERLCYKRGTAYATMSKVPVGKIGFCGCLIVEGVSACWKEKAQARVFILSPSLLLNHLKPQSSKAKLLLPIIPFGIATYSFTLLLDNLCRNSCILSNGPYKKESTYRKECRKVPTFAQLCYCSIILLIGSINKIYQNFR